MSDTYLEIQDAPKPQRSSCLDVIKEWWNAIDKHWFAIVVLQAVYSAFIFYCGNVNREHLDALRRKQADVPQPMNVVVAMWIHAGYLLVRYLLDLQFCWSCRTQFPMTTPIFIWASFAFCGLQLICQCLIGWAYIGRTEPKWSAMIAIYVCFVLFCLLERLLRMKIPVNMKDDVMQTNCSETTFTLSRILMVIPAIMLVPHPNDVVKFLGYFYYFIVAFQSECESMANFALRRGPRRQNPMDVFGNMAPSAIQAGMMLWFTNENLLDSAFWIILRGFCVVYWAFFLLCHMCIRHCCLENPTDEAKVPV